MNTDVKGILDFYFLKYNRIEFIETDPIQVPHLFTIPEDIEISAFLTACLSWGQRKTIINKSLELMRLLGNRPYHFIMNCENGDLEPLRDFCHRTFNGTDAVFFVQSLQNLYQNHGGLRGVFERGFELNVNTSEAICYFRKIFFEIPFPSRTAKHVADVSRNASAKRINMFLRWMVRHDRQGVDFGLWRNISPSRLHVPLDLHSGKTARQLDLLVRKQNDWKAVCELTEKLREFDPADPVKYDFALFGLGIHKED